VIVSRQCYAESIDSLFEFGYSSPENEKFVSIINKLLSRCTKLPSGQDPSKTLGPGEMTHLDCLKRMNGIVIERLLKIFTSIALFFEQEKKVEKELQEKKKQKQKAELELSNTHSVKEEPKSGDRLVD